MVKRYFTAHGFFREAIREGRELLLGPNMLIFLAISSAFGICAIVILDVLRETSAFTLFIQWVPESTRFTIVALLAQPLILFIVMAGSYGLLLSIWTSTLSALSARSRWTLLPGQSFMLVVWSQWPMLLAMIAAGVISSSEQTQLFSMTLILAGLLILCRVGDLYDKAISAPESGWNPRN